jgi:hypothetical protein
MDLNYFWINIEQTTNISQNFYLNIYDTTNTLHQVSVTTQQNIGSYVLWYSGTNIFTSPTKCDFELLDSSINTIQFTGNIVSRIKKINLITKTNETNTFYLDSFGYSTDTIKYNLKFRQSYDNTIDEDKQLYLSSLNDYNMLNNNFVDINSSYPMDNIIII